MNPLRVSYVLSLLAITTHSAVAAESPASETTSQRPNIVFIFSDDHGGQAISAYGSTLNRTPHIDRIATEGMRFDRYFVTNAICAPSRAVILTGMHSHMIGHTTNERLFDIRLTTFPKLLQQAGYETALIGKWHLRTEPQGFDHYHVLINQGRYYNSPMIRNGERTNHVGYVTEVLTDLAIDWLAQQHDRPFLLMFNHKAPHASWEPGPRQLHMFDDVEMPEPPTLFDDFVGRSSAWTHAEMSIAEHMNDGALHLHAPTWQLNDEQLVIWNAAYEPKNAAFRAAKLHGPDLVRWKYQRYAKDYLRCVAAIDDSVGRVLDTLEANSLAENTIVIYSSDQGWFLGEHGWFDKRWMYEESYRTPLVVRWPGVTKPASKDRHLTQNLDLAPTLLEVAGVEPPKAMQGRSLVPLLRGESPADWPQSIYYHFFEDRGAHRVPRHYGVRTEHFKLIHFYLIDEWEMYDLRKDPDELSSVYHDPDYALQRRDLEQELQRLRRQFAVTPHADVEVTAFQATQQARRDFMQRLGRRPSRWGIDVTAIPLETHADHTRERLVYALGGRRIEADLLIPRNGQRLHPAVLALHPGLSLADNGAAGKSTFIDPQYQMPLALELVRRGYVVLCPDRLGFESRRAPNATDNDASDQAFIQHETKRLLAAGTNLMGMNVSEMIFAVSYLAQRPEVHEKRIGVVGVGEGGQLATILAYAFEDVACGISINGTSRFADAFASDAGRRPEPLQLIPDVLSWGDIDTAITGIYPRPFLEISTDRDRTAHFADARQRYDAEQRGEFLRHTFLSGETVFSPPVRENTYQWLDRWLK